MAKEAIDLTQLAALVAQMMTQNAVTQQVAVPSPLTTLGAVPTPGNYQMQPQVTAEPKDRGSATATLNPDGTITIVGRLVPGWESTTGNSVNFLFDNNVQVSNAPGLVVSVGVRQPLTKSKNRWSRRG